MTDSRAGPNNNGTAVNGKGNCLYCHGGAPYNYDSAFATAHINPDHTGVAPSVNCATTCHTQSTTADIISITHKDTCALCHTDTTGNGTLISSAAGGSGDCVFCHSPYGADFQTHAMPTPHDGVISNQTPAGITDNCVTTDVSPRVSHVSQAAR